jgi:hypothetical protein
MTELSSPPPDDSLPPPHLRFTHKRDIVGIPVYISYLAAMGRKMTLEPWTSRAVCKNEIHELITTAAQAEPGGTVHDVGYLGFFEISHGGSMRIGDLLQINDRPIGYVLGFDATHLPNHLNIIIQCKTAWTGRDLQMRLEDQIRFSAEPTAPS